MDRDRHGQQERDPARPAVQPADPGGRGDPRDLPVHHQGRDPPGRSRTRVAPVASHDFTVPGLEKPAMLMAMPVGLCSAPVDAQDQRDQRADQAGHDQHGRQRRGRFGGFAGQRYGLGWSVRS